MSRPCDTGMCDVRKCTDSGCLQPLSPYKGKHCNYLGEDMCPGLIDANGRCDYCGCDYVVKEEKHTFTPSQILTDIRMHNTDKNKKGSNTFLNRYLESRTLRIPGAIYIQLHRSLSDWADRETARRLREDMEHFKHDLSELE